MTNWHSWSDFVHMGGYGLYVWGSYFVTLALLFIETATATRRRRRALLNVRRGAGS
jgi:heme exporter protein D